MQKFDIDEYNKEQKDKDLKDFYVRICKNTDGEKAKAVIKILNT